MHIGIGNGNPPQYSGKFHGQRRLAGYSPWVRKDLNVTELTHTHVSVCVCVCVCEWLYFLTAS